MKSTYDKTGLCPQFFCTVFAGNLLGVCTCFFASACAILKMEKNRCSEWTDSESSVFAFLRSASIEILSLKECCSWGKM